MNRIDKKFKELRRQKKKALISFITCGDPNLTTTYQLALEFDRGGTDILELGVPFSDPLADGPVIQAASGRALKNKVNLASVFGLVKRVREKSEMPIALLTYYNIIYRFGIKNFVKQARLAGVDGVIVPDLPVEEARELIKEARKGKLATIFLLAPTTEAKRIRQICSASSGFIYYVSLTGTTGVRKTLPEELKRRLRQIKRITAKPVCVGFGISSPQQAAEAAAVADGVIVGSAIIKVIERNLGHKDLVSKVAEFAGRLRGAL
ncbi:MAG: tryptophan synthase subunit alpha [Candidatus Omnitrophota bacterium]|nr:MAG: tryptophan synthase subunit alpha [Candidatus Omnitrophota bacterium]